MNTPETTESTGPTLVVESEERKNAPEELADDPLSPPEPFDGEAAEPPAPLDSTEPDAAAPPEATPAPSVPAGDAPPAPSPESASATAAPEGKPAVVVEVAAAKKGPEAPTLAEVAKELIDIVGPNHLSPTLLGRYHAALARGERDQEVLGALRDLESIEAEIAEAQTKANRATTEIRKQKELLKEAEKLVDAAKERREEQASKVQRLRKQTESVGDILALADRMARFESAKKKFYAENQAAYYLVMAATPEGTRNNPPSLPMGKVDLRILAAAEAFANDHAGHPVCATAFHERSVELVREELKRRREAEKKGAAKNGAKASDAKAAATGKGSSAAPSFDGREESSKAAKGKGGRKSRFGQIAATESKGKRGRKAGASAAARA